MTLLDEIKAKLTPALRVSRDTLAIAAMISVDRVKANTLQIGNGAILEAIGLTAGNSFLDAVNTTPAFRYVKPMLDRSTLHVGSPLVQATVQSLVPTVLTLAQADALCALGKSPDPVTELDVRKALYAVDGTWLGG